jgi:ribosomal protein S18 acetylase RimI-like enzyme
MMEIFEITQVTDEILEAFTRLIPQLSSAPIPRREQLEQIVNSEATTLLAARDPDAGAIRGLLALAVFRVPTGMRAWIEDVVVDQDWRGRGVGEALTKAALSLAAQKGAQGVELTSRPSREAANRLYLRLGFQPRKTNLYHYKIE